ncbi:50S ribosomal protein L13 [Rickettsiales bacterium (ex Bugula neritina AB1)]|nr:50S ribosomal protein L13 [Rickettsiales bacterium (ex Bugula neritina AB1)]
MNNKSFVLKKKDINNDFLLIDCSNLILGRLASYVALLLKGKHKVTYTPNMLCGSKVILINSDKILLTGNKKKQNLYRHHTGFFGGLKERKYQELKQGEAIKRAVKRMLNKCTLRNAMMKNLYIYEGEKHLHIAQKPKTISMR